MVTRDNFRSEAHKEIEDIAHTLAQVSRIVNHTDDEVESKIGLSWTNLSRIYFVDRETLGNIQDLKEALKSKEYLVSIKEEQNEPCLEVQSTRELFERLLDEDEL
jgi:hypothetical protein